MSRTERRIRHTGARGLAHVPLDFQRRRRDEAKALAEKQKVQKESNGRRDGDANGDSSRNV
jgi:hypothetical protein